MPHEGGPDHDGSVHPLHPRSLGPSLEPAERDPIAIDTDGPTLQANSSLAVRSAVLQGLGLAGIPLFAVGEDLACGRLVQVLPEWELAAQDVHALTTGRDYLPRKTRAFIDFFRGRIGSPPYWERGLPAPL